MEPTELRTVAVEIATTAAAHVRARRPEVFDTGTASESVQAKSTPTDPVTIVDTETEQLVRTLLAERRPGETVLGEEEGGSSSTDGTVQWVVDPIDGTVNYLYGIPAYSVSVAAQVDGRSLAGAVVDVARGVTYSASLGGGAERVDADGRRTELRCTDVQSVSMALLATGFAYSRSRRAEQGRIIAEILPHVRDIRRVGSAALDLCMVAAGLVDAHYEHGLNTWDWAAGALIASEAGAFVRVPPAAESGVDGGVTVASAPGIAVELVALFEQVGAMSAIADQREP